MKVLLFIDHLGSGGAQRQISFLAEGLVERGHAVELLVYWPEFDFFRHRLDLKGVPIHVLRKKSGFDAGVAKDVRRLCRKNGYQVLVSFLDSPSLYAELSSLGGLGIPLVVSERNSHLNDRSKLAGLCKRIMHLFADQIVTNSVAHAEWIRKHHFWLRKKVCTVYNGVEISSFSGVSLVPDAPNAVRLLAIARVTPQKNVVTLLHALEKLRNTTGFRPSLTWVGRREDQTHGQRAYLKTIDEILSADMDLASRIQWVGERDDIPTLLAEHHALVHPSLYEGLPNVICEALAAGRPVLASRVCDNPLLIPHGDRGLLFDPHLTSSIATAIGELCGQSAEDWTRMSRNARVYAEHALSKDAFVGSFENILSTLVKNSET